VYFGVAYYHVAPVRAQAITITQTITLRGIQFVQRGKKFAMAYESAAAPAGVVRHAANKTKLSSGCASFRRCKWLRLIARARQRGFYEFTAGGQNKFLFSNFAAVSLVERREEF